MNKYKRQDLKISFFFLLPFLLLSSSLISQNILEFILSDFSDDYLVYIIKGLSFFILIYALGFLYVFYSLHFARKQKKWALKLPYLALLPFLISIALILYFAVDLFILSSDYGLGGIIIVFLVPVLFLVAFVSVMLFFLLNRKVKLLFKEGEPDL
jgi:hypothetical protein